MFIHNQAVYAMIIKNTLGEREQLAADIRRGLGYEHIDFKTFSNNIYDILTPVVLLYILLPYTNAAVCLSLNGYIMCKKKSNILCRKKSNTQVIVQIILIV